MWSLRALLLDPIPNTGGHKTCLEPWPRPFEGCAIAALLPSPGGTEVGSACVFAKARHEGECTIPASWSGSDEELPPRWEILKARDRGIGTKRMCVPRSKIFHSRPLSQWPCCHHPRHWRQHHLAGHHRGAARGPKPRSPSARELESRGFQTAIDSPAPCRCLAVPSPKRCPRAWGESAKRRKQGPGQHEGNASQGLLP